MYEVRLFLEKKGRIRFVSHLDMFRLMQRAVRRAELPIWYTQGFNPHPYISFLLALSLGVEGEAEPVDIRITEEISLSEIKERLNAVMPEGLKIKNAALPFHKPSEIAFGEYLITVDKNDITEQELFTALTSGQLFCEKSGKSKGKKITKTVDLSEHIKSFSIEKTEESLLVKTVLPAGSVFNLNPIQLFEGISAYCGKTVAPLTMVRTGLLCENGETFY